MGTVDTMTGRPSVDRPWLKYYPEALQKMIHLPECTVEEYLHANCPGDDVDAIDFYGTHIRWGTVFSQADQAARALRSLGFGEGDQIPVFLANAPEFIYLLLAAEKIGASLLSRDNTLRENVEAVHNSGAKGYVCPGLAISGRARSLPCRYGCGACRASRRLQLLQS